jgi:hypothetical protein
MNTPEELQREIYQRILAADAKKRRESELPIAIHTALESAKTMTTHLSEEEMRSIADEVERDVLQQYVRCDDDETLRQSPNLTAEEKEYIASRTIIHTFNHRWTWAGLSIVLCGVVGLVWGMTICVRGSIFLGGSICLVCVIPFLMQWLDVHNKKMAQATGKEEKPPMLIVRIYMNNEKDKDMIAGYWKEYGWIPAYFQGKKFNSNPYWIMVQPQFIREMRLLHNVIAQQAL